MEVKNIQKRVIAEIDLDALEENFKKAGTKIGTAFKDSFNAALGGSFDQLAAAMEKMSKASAKGTNAANAANASSAVGGAVGGSVAGATVAIFAMLGFILLAILFAIPFIFSIIFMIRYNIVKNPSIALGVLTIIFACIPAGILMLVQRNVSNKNSQNNI